MSDDYTRARLDWLDRIALDTRIAPGAFRLAFIISGFINRKTGEAWPGIDLLAKALGSDERTVRRLTNELVGAGYLAKQRGGDGKTNRYRMAADGAEKKPDHGESRPDKNVHSDPFRPDKNVHSEKSRPDIPVRADRTFLSEQTGQKCPPNSLKENPLNKEPSEEGINRPLPLLFSEEVARRENSSALRQGNIPGFGEFWAAYPKRVARAAAEKAFARAVAGGASPASIIAGARRYAVDREGQDPKWTKHPATWLNGECWTDEPAGGVVIDQHGNRVAASNGRPMTTGDFVTARAEALKAQGVLGADVDWMLPPPGQGRGDKP